MCCADCLPVKFTPGQWLDTFIPGLDKAGGFTITSTPSEARPSSHLPAFLELAVITYITPVILARSDVRQIQKSSNPPAQWLSRPEEEIIGKQLVVRVGGSFTWPPPSLDPRGIDRLVLIAAGVGINPLISIFSHLVRTRARPREIHFLYGTKTDSEMDPQRILFLPRLMDLIGIEADPKVTLRLFLTGTGSEGSIEHGKLPNKTFARRLGEDDLVRGLDGYGADSADRSSTVCYVCGPAKMTDETVAFLQKQRGMDQKRVLCEKWW